jgi:hypothetical protein
MLNALATLLLSFYANVCMGLYKDGYFSAQTLKESVFDITAMVAGTIPDNMIEVRMEFWRTINLYHLCSYAAGRAGERTASACHSSPAHAHPHTLQVRPGRQDAHDIQPRQLPRARRHGLRRVRRQVEFWHAAPRRD